MVGYKLSWVTPHFFKTLFSTAPDKHPSWSNIMNNECIQTCETDIVLHLRVTG